jgi:hypothetical protein
MLVCKIVDVTKSYINRSNVHWRIGGRRSCGATFCGGIDGAKRRKGGECCCDETTIIHKSAGGSITRHKGVNDGGSTTKGDGDGTVRIGSCSEEKTHNTGQNYTFGERY